MCYNAGCASECRTGVSIANFNQCNHEMGNYFGGSKWDENGQMWNTDENGIWQYIDNQYETNNIETMTGAMGTLDGSWSYKIIAVGDEDPVDEDSNTDFLVLHGN